MFCDAPALVIAFYRMAGATALLLPFVRWRLVRDLSTATRWYIILAGFCLALHFAAWIHSVQTTSVASAVFLVSTQPLFAALLGYLFLRESIPRIAGIGILIAFLGMATIAAGDFHGGTQHFSGNFLALAAACLGAVYLLIGRKIRKDCAFLPYLFSVYLVSAVFLGGFVVGFGHRLFPYPPPTFFWMGMLAVGCSLIGHGSLNWAVRSIRIYLVNLAILVEPVLATVYAYFLFDQRQGILSRIGAALVIGGLAVAFLAERRLLLRNRPMAGSVPGATG